MKSKIKNYFSKCEIYLWCISVFFIVISFIAFDRQNYIAFFASIIGVTSLIFNAKANPLGQALMIVFSIIYAYLSLKTRYYGELITYLFMTMPMSAAALVSWLKNPFNENKSEVKISAASKKDIILMCIFAAVTTWVFYYVLKAFNTNNLILSTVSVTTSFAAVYLTYLRSPYFALGYTANDIVLIGLWASASLYDSSCISVTVCFSAFLANDIYGFLNWQKIRKAQSDFENA